MNKVAMLAFIGIIGAIQADAQASLSPVAALPKQDGAIGAGEYAYTTTIKGMKIVATLGSDDNLYLGIEARTSGWVALGTGNLAMNGSRLYMGALRSGSPVMSEMLGAGHGTKPAQNTVVEKWAVAQAAGATTLELVLPSKEAIAKGSLNLIFSFASSPDFRVKHKARGSVSFTIK